MRGRSPLISTTLLVALATFTATASGQERLDRNDFAIDFVSGTVLGSGRATSMGGAYVALAEGIDASTWNPASYGARTPSELSWFEWDITASLLLPGVFTTNDFFNTGRDERTSAIFVGLGARLQFGDTGVGFVARALSFTIDDATESTYSASFTGSNFGGARQFLDGQLVIGVGVRTAGLVLSEGGRDLVSFTGIGFETGFLFRPVGEHYRVGAALRTPVISGEVEGEGVVRGDDGVERVAGFVLPRSVDVPWEAEAGVAFQIGTRPLNRAFVHPWREEQRARAALTLARQARERAQVEAELAAEGRTSPPSDAYVWMPRRARDRAYLRREAALQAEEDAALDAALDRAEADRKRAFESLSRAYLLVSTELLVVGETSGGIGIEGFLDQQRISSGSDMTIGARLGLETELIENLLKVRAGSYLEPTRFEDSDYRVHGTGGVDLRLFRTDIFGLFSPLDVRVSATMDVAERWFDWGVGVGVWH